MNKTPDLIKEKLEILASDETTIQAIRYIFRESLEKHKPLVERTDDNKILGEKFRAYETAKQINDDAFASLINYKVNKITNKQINRGK